MQHLQNNNIRQHNGPYIEALDQTLSTIGVQRQAYFGGTFVGNHVHKCCQVRMYMK